MDMNLLKDLDIMAAIHHMVEQQGNDSPLNLMDPATREAYKKSLTDKLAVTRRLLSDKKTNQTPQ